MILSAIMTLAQQGKQPWEQLRDSMRSTGGSPTVPMLWALAFLGTVVLAVIVVMWVSEHRRKGRMLTGPLMVFHKFAGQWGLAWADQWLLVRIARQQQLPTPLVLMTSPATLRHYGAEYLASVTPFSRRRREEQLQAIERRLFTDGEPAAQETA